MPKISPTTAEKITVAPVAAADAVAPRSAYLTKLFLLAFYFSLTMALTLHTKWIMLGKAKMPWLLSSYHLGLSGIGAFLLNSSTQHRQQRRIIIGSLKVLLSGEEPPLGSRILNHLDM
jgi:hypothetical protein